MMRTSVLKPLSVIYSQIVDFKNALYDRKQIKTYQAPVPVISIGNLTMGGTGKTPVTDFLLRSLVSKGKKVAVISRSYKADVSSPSLVDVHHPYSARYYGDEPVLLAQHNPKVDVYVGPTKWKTAQYACEEDQYDVLLVDDGFQHRKLHRDLNVVILDATEQMENYEVVPQGRGRESWASLERADLIVLSKANLATEEALTQLQNKLPNKPFLPFNYQIKEMKDIKTHEIYSRERARGKKMFLVSAIARPDVFEKMMGEIGQLVPGSIHYRDHHQYTREDVAQMIQKFKQSGADMLVTTSKDAVKLVALWPKHEKLWVTNLEIAEVGQKGVLLEKVYALCP